MALAAQVVRKIFLPAGSFAVDRFSSRFEFLADTVHGLRGSTLCEPWRPRPRHSFSKYRPTTLPWAKDANLRYPGSETTILTVWQTLTITKRTSLKPTQANRPYAECSYRGALRIRSARLWRVLALAYQKVSQPAPTQELWDPDRGMSRIATIVRLACGRTWHLACSQSLPNVDRKSVV